MQTNRKDVFPAPQHFKSLKSGDRLFSAGDKGESMFLVTEGVVSVVCDQGCIREVAELKKGEIFGEKAYISKGRFVRQFSVVAKTNAVVLEVRRDNFNKVEQLIPNFASRVIETLISRLQRSERLIRVLEPVDKKRRVVLAILSFKGPNDQLCECLEDGSINPLTVDQIQDLTLLETSFILGCIEDLMGSKVIAERDGLYYLLDERRVKEYGGISN